METSQGKREVIILLHEEGRSNGEIARRLAISKHTVARWIRRHEETGGTVDKPRSGRSKCTTREQDMAISNAIINEPFTPAPQIRRDLGLVCSAQTVRNRHHSNNLHGRTPAKKPELSELNMEQRMEYALEYVDKPPNFWENVIFCDEKTYCSDDMPESVVWRPVNTR